LRGNKACGVGDINSFADFASNRAKQAENTMNNDESGMLGKSDLSDLFTEKRMGQADALVLIHL
jgi:hypothetical protein